MKLEILDVLGRHASHLAQKPALIDQRSFSYAEMWSISGDIARGLSEVGLRSGDRLAVAFTPSAEYALLILGSLRAGLVVAPLNTRLTPHELEDYFTRVKPRAVIVDEKHLAAIEMTGLPRVVAQGSAETWVFHSSLPRSLGESVVEGSGAAFIIGTGGTTGTPKGAIISHRATWMWAICAAFAQQLHQSDVELFGSPFFHSTVLTGLISPLVAGATVRVIGHYDVESVVEAVVRDGGTRLAGAPTMLRRVLGSAIQSPELWSGVRLVQFGSTKCPPGFVDAVQDALPHAELITGYGTTEFGPATRVYTPDFFAGVDAGIGRPVPAADVIIIDPSSLRTLRGPDSEGEIAVACPWQMDGYAGADAENSATMLASGHIRSGDVGSFDERGYLHFQGRYKEIIITGGENVFPTEVEKAIARHPAVADVAVYGVDDDVWGERVEAAIVLRTGQALSTQDLREFCRPVLAGFKIPSTVVERKELPLTANLKVDKRLLIKESSDSSSPNLGTVQ
jgi:fatty-acyl-CoA synthase